jgi:flavin-dependent dehydrogenase
MTENVICTDICIIGAGPAGLAASWQLSKLGIRHLLAEAESFPRHKPCGDIITSPVLRALQRMDPEILQELKKENLLNPIWKTQIFPPNNQALSLDFLPFNGLPGEASCYAVSRYDLDAVLKEKVVSMQMVDFREFCRIKTIEKTEDGLLLQAENGTILKTKLAIFASGSSGLLPAKLGRQIPDQECAIGIRVHYENVHWNSTQTALFLDQEEMPGGLYITPLPQGRCNVNLVLSLKKVRKEKIALKEKLEQLLQEKPVLREAFAKARRIGTPEGSRLYLGLKKRPVSGANYLLAGDAAGLIEFFSGNGIPQALESGLLAAKTAAEALNTADFSAAFLLQYDQELYLKYPPGKLSTRLVFPLLHQRFFSRLLLGFLNYLASRPHTNALLRDLLYARNPGRILRKPGFYYALFFRRVPAGSTALRLSSQPG